MSLATLRARLDRLTGRAHSEPEGPLVPIIPVDSGPPPRGCRYMGSEEAIREVERLLRGESSPSVLTPAQRAELDRRFEVATGGVERVERLAREFLEAPGVSP